MDQPDSPPRSADGFELLHAIEARRTQSDNFAWTVPGLALTAQAFLLTIALSGGTSATGRLLAAICGFAAVTASLHFHAKQGYYFDLFEAVAEAERTNLGLPGTNIDALLARRPSFPTWSPLVKGKYDRWWMQKLFVQRKSVWVWRTALLVFLMIDLFLVVYALVQLIGGDPGWFNDLGGH